MALTLAAAVAFPAAAETPPPAPVAARPAPPRPPPPKPPAADAGVDEDAAAVDDELLEFLGSVGDDADGGGDWLDFLASTDVERVAKRGAKAPVRAKREKE
jgi:hypothetical protein